MQKIEQYGKVWLAWSSARFLILYVYVVSYAEFLCGILLLLSIWTDKRTSAWQKL